jgi:hypothetical protein
MGDQLVVAISQMLGLGAFFWLVIRGLRKEVISLKGVVEAQKLTLEAAEHTGGIYRKMLQDFPQDLENYKSSVLQMKDDTIKALQAAVAGKNDKESSEAKASLQLLERLEVQIGEVMAISKAFTINREVLEAKFREISLLALPVAKDQLKLPPLTPKYGSFFGLSDNYGWNWEPKDKK